MIELCFVALVIAGCSSKPASPTESPAPAAPTRPAPAPQPSVDPSKLAAECTALATDRKWVDLEACGHKLREVDQPGGKRFVETAIAEARAEVAMRELARATKNWERAAAEEAAAKIPDTSVYRPEAAQLLAQVKKPQTSVNLGGAQVGEDCSKGQSCKAPATCVSYLGIAGARGPTFKTCEIKCTGKAACPAGLACQRIADGPGEVCR